MWDELQLFKPHSSILDRYDIVRFGPDAEANPAAFDALGFIEEAISRLPLMGVDAVVSSSDYPGCLVAAVIACEIGLPGPDIRSLLTASHKYFARESMAKSVPDATPEFRLIDPFNLDTLAGLSFPLYVKPVKSNFSMHARMVRSIEELEQHLATDPLQFHLNEFVRPFDQLLQKYGAFDFGAGYMIAEEVLNGHQITVDGFVAQGRVTVTGVVDTVMYPGTGSFARFEYPTSLDESVFGRITDVTERAVAGLGLNTTLFNIEMVYNEARDSLHIIEINPRMCGQFADLHESVDGINTYEIMMKVGLGRSGICAPNTTVYGAAASFALRHFSDATVLRLPALTDVQRAFEQDALTLFHTYTAEQQRLSDNWKQFDGFSYRYAVANIQGNTRQDVRKELESVRNVLPIELQSLGAPAYWFPAHELSACTAIRDLERHVDELLEIAHQLELIQQAGIEVLWLLVGDRTSVSQLCDIATAWHPRDTTYGFDNDNRPLCSQAEGHAFGGTIKSVKFEARAITRHTEDNVLLGHAIHLLGTPWPALQRLTTIGQMRSRSCGQYESIEAAHIIRSVEVLRNDPGVSWAAGVVLDKDQPEDATSLVGLVARTASALAVGGPTAHPSTPTSLGLASALTTEFSGALHPDANPIRLRPASFPPMLRQRHDVRTTPSASLRPLSEHWLSIATAVHVDHSEFLVETFESICAQRWDHEFGPIIWNLQVDGLPPGQPSNAIETLLKLATSQEKVVVDLQWNGRAVGVASTRNAALERVSTPYVVFVDGDDLLEPTALLRTCRAFSSNDRTGWVLGKKTDWWSEKTSPTEQFATDQDLASRFDALLHVEVGGLADRRRSGLSKRNQSWVFGPICEGSYGFGWGYVLGASTDVVKALGGDAPLAMQEDFAMLYRLGEMSAGAFLSQPLGLYRRSPDQMTAHQKPLDTDVWSIKLFAEMAALQIRQYGV